MTTTETPRYVVTGHTPPFGAPAYAVIDTHTDSISTTGNGKPRIVTSLVVADEWAALLNALDMVLGRDLATATGEEIRACAAQARTLLGSTDGTVSG
jgi:hypothetical protein